MYPRLVASNGKLVGPSQGAAATRLRHDGAAFVRSSWDLVCVHCEDCGAAAHLVVRDIPLDALRCPCCTRSGTCRAVRLAE